MTRRKRKKTRSAASYRNASLKAHRTQRRMQLARLEQKRIDETVHTIDLLPKVQWS